MKRLLAVFSILILLINIAMPVSASVSASGSVTYDGNAHEFIFSPGTKESPSNLFGNFQNVMPGDKLTDQIVIKNNSRKVKIQVYLCSLGAQKETDDFLSQLKLTVTQGTKTKLFDGPADESAQLSDWVYLGTLSPGGKTTLNLTLEVPITVGNDFQNQAGYIDWVFMVKEIPIDTNTPATGDESNLIFYGGLMAISLAAVILLLLWKKREQEEEIC